MGPLNFRAPLFVPGLHSGDNLTTAEFKKFCHEAVHSLMALNEHCGREYDISAWPRWDYDLDAGTLIFSEGGTPKVIASIQVVGTTSADPKNWLWGWANKNMPPKVVDRVREVRTFGEREGLTLLTGPYQPDNEHLGWELAAVTAQIVRAKGAYRCPVDDGFIYVVYMDIRNVNSDDIAVFSRFPNKSFMECADHGKGISTFVCEHLAATPHQEWFSSISTDSNPWPDAWCSKCDEIYSEQGAWNDKNEERMKIKILCHRCYEKARGQATSHT